MKTKYIYQQIIKEFLSLYFEVRSNLMPCHPEHSKAKGRIIFILLPFLLFTFVQIQAQNWEWARQGSSPKLDFINAMDQGPSGKVYVGGSITSGPFQLAGKSYTVPEHSIVVASYNEGGDVLWSKVFQGQFGIFGGTSDDDIFGLYDLKVDDSENIYITGLIDPFQFTQTVSYSFGNGVSLSINPGLDKRTFVLKLDANGNPQWAKLLGSSTSPGNEVFGYGIAVEGNNLYVAGSTQSTGQINFGNSVILENSLDVNFSINFIVKYNAANGLPIWATKTELTVPVQFELTNAEQLLFPKIELDDAGNIYTIGQYTDGSLIYSAGVATPAQTFVGIPNEASSYLVKYNSLGVFQWSRTVLGVGSSAGLGSFTNNLRLTVNKSGKVTILGLSTAEEINIQTSFSTTVTLINQNQLGGATADQYLSLYLAQYNTNGDIIWTNGGDIHRYEDPDDFDVIVKEALFLGIDSDEDGNVYFAGGSAATELNIDGIVIQNTPGMTNPDGEFILYVAKLDNTGTAKWIKTADGGLMSGCLSDLQLNVNNDQELFITGFIVGASTFNTDELVGVIAAPGEVPEVPDDADDLVGNSMIAKLVNLNNCRQISFETSGSCVNEPISFTNTSGPYPPALFNSFLWEFGDGTSVNGYHPYTTGRKTYQATGVYDVTLSFPNTIFDPEGCPDPTEFSLEVEVRECGDCGNCVGSFAPVRGERYWLSAWVKQSPLPGNATPPKTYTYPSITLEYTDNQNNVSAPHGSFFANPNMPPIDGWQRIEQEFIIPPDAIDISVKLENTSPIGRNIEVFFDDIRIHPFNANMKSFVYDPETLRLVAELDENNYATFYEYDEEGALIRVKKETSRGIKTIQESRNNTFKQ